MSQRNERSGPELDSVTHWMIRQAAALAPECLSSRLEEEWLADSEFRSSTLSRVRFALGCCWATVVIVNDYSRDRDPAMSPVAAGGFGTFADRNFSYVKSASAPVRCSWIVGILCRAFLRSNHHVVAYARIGGIPEFAAARAGRWGDAGRDHPFIADKMRRVGLMHACPSRVHVGRRSGRGRSFAGHEQP